MDFISLKLSFISGQYDFISEEMNFISVILGLYLRKRGFYFRIFNFKCPKNSLFMVFLKGKKFVLNYIKILIFLTLIINLMNVYKIRIYSVLVFN